MSVRDTFVEPYSDILGAFIDDLLRREEAKECVGRLSTFYTDALPIVSARLKQNTERLTELDRQLHFRKVADDQDRMAIEIDRIEMDQLLTEGDELIDLMDPASRDWLPALDDYHRAADMLWTWATLESYVANTFRLALVATATAEHREKRPDAPLTQTHRRRIHTRVKKAYEAARRKGMPGVIAAFEHELGIQVTLTRDDEEALASARQHRNRIVHDSLQFKVGRDGGVSVTGTRARQGDLISGEELEASDRVCYRVMLAVDGAVTTALVGPGAIDPGHEAFRTVFRTLSEGSGGFATA